jgi:pheromone shutdown protein TraB
LLKMSDLILVGTVHLDPEGRKSLYKIIENLSPNILTVEISNFSIRYRLSNQERWLHRLKDLTRRLPEERRFHTRLKLLRLQLHLPFE